MDVFKTIFDTGKTLGTNLQTVSAIFALVAAVIAGIGFFLTKRAADESKSKIGQIIMGIGVVLLAPSAITFLYTLFGGNAPSF